MLIERSQLQQTTCYDSTYMECRQIYRWKAEQWFPKVMGKCKK